MTHSKKQLLRKLERELKEILITKTVCDRLKQTANAVDRHDEETALYLKESSTKPVEKIGNYRI